MFDTKLFLNRMTLITGDVNAGKTRFTRDILDAFLEEGERDIAVIDLAPEMYKGIGGKMADIAEQGVLYMTTGIDPPRLLGRNQREVQSVAKKNAAAIDRLFTSYLGTPKKVLFINDVTLYLHRGTMERLCRVISNAETRIINAYYGESLGDSALSRKERRLVEELMTACDLLISL